MFFTRFSKVNYGHLVPFPGARVHVNPVINRLSAHLIRVLKSLSIVMYIQKLKVILQENQQTRA